MEGELYPKLSFSFAILQICLVLMRILSYYKSITAQLRFGNGVTIRLFGKKMFWPYALSDPFLIINLVSSIFSLTMFGYTWRADPFGWKMALMPSRYDDVGHDSHLLEIWADVAAFAVGMLYVPAAVAATLVLMLLEGYLQHPLMMMTQCCRGCSALSFVLSQQVCAARGVIQADQDHVGHALCHHRRHLGRRALHVHPAALDDRLCLHHLLAHGQPVSRERGRPWTRPCMQT